MVAQRPRRAARSRPRQSAPCRGRVAAVTRRRRSRAARARPRARRTDRHAAETVAAMIRRLLRDVFVLCVALCGVATAQSKAGVVDRIVAVVGTRPILMSELEEQVAQLQSQGQRLPSDSTGLAKLRRRILDDMINQELEVQQAQRDTSIKVTEREVQ